jgi:hypothetical protein
VNGAYAHIQGTRPYTAPYALNHSPVGLAAWIIEKLREWSDCDGDVYRSFTRDELLANKGLLAEQTPYRHLYIRRRHRSQTGSNRIDQQHGIGRD